MRSSDNPARSTNRYQISDWYFDAELHQLQRDDQQIRLEPRVAQLLTWLVTHPGQAASREQLMEALWPGVVVGDEALNNAVNKLRRAFGDDRQNPEFIETLPKIGYRLIAPVKPVAAAGAPAADAAVNPATTVAAARSILTLAIVLLVALAGALSWSFLFSEPDKISESIKLTGERSIAVLPFENLNQDPAQDYFADGMSDDLITGLSRVPGLLVISRSSSYAMRDQRGDIRQIARSLNANFIIEGSVRREAEKLRINAQLVDTSSGHQIWAQRFDGSTSEVFDLQDQITRQIVAALESKLGAAGHDLIAARPTKSLQAYDLYLQGSGMFQRFSRGDTFESRQFFTRALELDAEFSDAYAMLAWTYVFEYTNGWSSEPQDTLEQALQLANRSIAIDRHSSLAHFVRGLVYRERKKFDLARAEAKRALEIEPSYANGYVLMATLSYYAGEPQQGLDLLEIASRLNPLHPSNYPFHKGQALFILQRYDEAIEAFEFGLTQNPTSQRLRVWLAATYAQKGLLEEAAWEADEILSEDPEFSPARLETIFPFQQAEDLNRFNAALKKAGFSTLTRH